MGYDATKWIDYDSTKWIDYDSAMADWNATTSDVDGISSIVYYLIFSRVYIYLHTDKSLLNLVNINQIFNVKKNLKKFTFHVKLTWKNAR